MIDQAHNINKIFHVYNNPYDIIIDLIIVLDNINVIDLEYYHLLKNTQNIREIPKYLGENTKQIPFANRRAIN